MSTLDPTQLAVLTSVIIPLVVGLITKKSANKQVKAITNIVVTAVAALLGNAVNDLGVAVFSAEMITNFIIGLVISIASYYGVYENFEINAKLAPNKGIG